MRGAVKNYVFGQRKIKKPSMLFEFDGNIEEKIHGFTNIKNYNNVSKVEFGVGKVGQAINFTGNQSGIRRPSMVRVPIPVIPNVSDLPFSISVWIKKTADNGASNAIFGWRGGTGNSTEMFALNLETTGIVLARKYSAAGNREIRSTSTIEIGDWNLITYIDGGIGNEKILINNVEEFVSITDSGYTSMSDRNPYGFGISSHSQANYSGATLIGWFDQLAIWIDHELTDDERDYIWNNGNGRQIF